MPCYYKKYITCLLILLTTYLFSAFGRSSVTLIDTVPSALTIGMGEQFTSLTNNGGLFEFINNRAMTGNVTVSIASDLIETGTHSLHADSTYGFQLTILPSTASIKNIYNASNLTVAMVRLIDIKNISFDGSFNGTGRYLRFINTHSNPDSCRPVIFIDSSSTGNIVSNCIVESNNRPVNGNWANILFGSNGQNNSNTILNNWIGDAKGSPGIAGRCLISLASNNNNNKKITISKNEIVNFGFYGIQFYQVGDSCLIDSNHFYDNHPIPHVFDQTSIRIEGNGRGHVISNNYIGGTAPYCAGGPWINNGSVMSSGLEFGGIRVYTTIGHDTGIPIRILNNTIQNISLPFTGNVQFIGIWVIANSIVQNNIIGHSSNPNSILNASSSSTGVTTGILIQSADTARVTGNIVANMNATGTSVWSTSVNGIGMQGGYIFCNNNTIHDLSTAGTGSSVLRITGVTGLSYNGTNLLGAEIEQNKVYNLRASNAGKFAEINGVRGSSGSIISLTNRIIRNNVYNLENASDSGFIYGIYLTLPKCVSENNQVSITNSNNTNRSNIFGIYDATTNTDTNKLYYNSVYIGGSTNTGNRNSYALRGNIAAIKSFQNNILYNERTGGTGSHFAIGSINAEPWPAQAANCNLYIVADSLKVAAWTTLNTPQSMISWRGSTGGDVFSYAALASNAPSASFFQSPASGNLNINYNDPICWYVNGKGVPVSHISADYDSAADIRSTTIPDGATDIGSDEFNTTTLPPPLIVLGRHIPGFTDSLMLNERLIATITWGNAGTLPNFNNPRFYTGMWPNDTTNGLSTSNARTMNVWLDIPVTGGAGYNYSISFYYDSSMLGKIQNASQLMLHKKNTGESGSWQMLFPTLINSSLKKATANDLTSFSEFTGAENTAPLTLPGSSICSAGTTSYKTNLVATGYTYQWQVNTGSGFVDLANNTIYSGANDSILVITAPPSSYNRYEYRCITNTGSGTSNSISFTLKIVNTWIGTADTDWTNPLNWNCGSIPDSNTDVIIKSGLTNYPVINSSIICRSVIASNGSSVHVNSGGSLQLTGN